MKKKKNIKLKTKITKTERPVIILWDSKVKHHSVWEISKRLLKLKVHVKHFCYIKTQCMKDFLKLLLCQNPTHFILHVRSNNLKTEKSSKVIAKEIINIAVSLKSEAHNVSVSNITVCKTVIN